MAKKDKKESLHEMSVPELQAQLKESRETNFRLNFSTRRTVEESDGNPGCPTSDGQNPDGAASERAGRMMEQKSDVPPMNLRQARKMREGIVVSDKMDKTRVVVVSWSTTHPRYHKVLRRSSRFHAHDEKNESHSGDRVQIVETRPLSKLKRWRVTQILEKSV